VIGEEGRLNCKAVAPNRFHGVRRGMEAMGSREMVGKILLLEHNVAQGAMEQIVILIKFQRKFIYLISIDILQGKNTYRKTDLFLETESHHLEKIAEIELIVSNHETTM
jgi:hypothetical protein